MIDIRMEFEEYMKACYAGQDLSPMQKREVEQAFLSGIHTLNESMLGDDLLRVKLRRRLTEIMSFPGGN